MENSESDGNTRPPDLPLDLPGILSAALSQHHLSGFEIAQTYMQIRKQQLELDMEQQTGSK